MSGIYLDEARKEEFKGENGETVIGVAPFAAVHVNGEVQIGFFGLTLKKSIKKFANKPEEPSSYTPSFDEVPPGQGPGRDWEK